MRELPKGWEWTTIGEVGDVQLGRQRSPKNHHGPHMRPYLRSANVTWRGIDVSDVNEMNFEPDEAVTFELRPGDLLLNEASGSPNEVGKPAIWRGEIEGCCFQNTLLRMRPRLVSTEYLYWYCRSVALDGRFGEAGRGVNIRHLGKQGLSGFPLAVPPREEQERIVAAIEEHLSHLDAAGTLVTSARRRAATLRRAVLAEWFPDPGRRRTSTLPAGWEWTTVGEVATVQLGRQRSPRNHVGPHMRPYLRSANVTWHGIDLADVKEMNFEPGEAATFELKPGDLLLNEASGSPSEVGKPAIWRGEIEGCCFQNTLLRVRPKKASIEYLYWYFRASALAGRFGEAGRGVNIRHLGKQGLATFPLALPPLSEQERIVAVIEERLSGVDDVERLLATDRAAPLRRSILAAAFSGRLVAQDPSDEPASVLLERIRAERAAAGPGRRRR